MHLTVVVGPRRGRKRGERRGDGDEWGNNKNSNGSFGATTLLLLLLHRPFYNNGWPNG